jgi:hypothetical protein
VRFLEEYELAWSTDDQTYRAHADPWEALMTGLDKRRARDLPAMVTALSNCRRELADDLVASEQVGKLISLIDDLTAIHAQTFRLPTRMLRSMLGFSGRAARLIGGGKR